MESLGPSFQTCNVLALSISCRDFAVIKEAVQWCPLVIPLHPCQEVQITSLRAGCKHGTVQGWESGLRVPLLWELSEEWSRESERTGLLTFFSHKLRRVIFGALTPICHMAPDIRDARRFVVVDASARACCTYCLFTPVDLHESRLGNSKLSG